MIWDMVDPEDIRGWHRLDAATTTSGRLLPDDTARLAAIEVRHVINLALDDHPKHVWARGRASYTRQKWHGRLEDGLETHETGPKAHDRHPRPGDDRQDLG